MHSKNSLEIKRCAVGFFDSGVGGLPYLALAESRLPHEWFVYIADTENYPYGDKSPGEIRSIVMRLMDRVCQKVTLKCMVIACNTASVVALDDLRKQYPIPFVGVVPAVKPAAAFSEKKKIGVLATLRTVKDEYLKHLISDFADGCEVIVVPVGEIRDIVEKRFFTATPDEKKALLKNAVQELKAREVDAVVLGCTQLLFLEKEFTEVLGNGISVIDSREGVVNQLVRVVKTHNIAAREKSGESRLYITGPEDPSGRYLRFSREFGLSFSGTL
jgi:glutamate racemase